MLSLVEKSQLLNRFRTLISGQWDASRSAHKSLEVTKGCKISGPTFLVSGNQVSELIDDIISGLWRWRFRKFTKKKRNIKTSTPKFLSRDMINGFNHMWWELYNAASYSQRPRHPSLNIFVKIKHTLVYITLSKFFAPRLFDGLFRLLFISINYQQKMHSSKGLGVSNFQRSWIM
jgi:hypothetical protein